MERAAQVLRAVLLLCNTEVRPRLSLITKLMKRLWNTLFKVVLQHLPLLHFDCQRVEVTQRAWLSQRANAERKISNK